jgi:hypothetical protein
LLENRHEVTKSTKKRTQYLSQRRKVRKEIKPALVTPDRCRLRRPEKVTPRKDKSGETISREGNLDLSFLGVTFSGPAPGAGQRSGATAQVLSFWARFKKSIPEVCSLRALRLCERFLFVLFGLRGEYAQ